MKPTLLLKAALLVCAAAVPLAQASMIMGVIARIDKVVLEPGAGPAETVQIWGVFSFSDGTGQGNFSAPARGYLYAKVAGNAQATLNEWNDLKQAAGTGQVLAFGVSGRGLRLRKPSAKAEDPDPYPLNVGVAKFQGRPDYAPVKALLDYKD